MLKFIFIFILIFASCKGRESQTWIEKEIRNLYGQKIIFTNNLIGTAENIYPSIDHLRNKNYKIISYIDSADCTPCSLKNIKLWNNFKDELEGMDIGLIFIIQNSNKEEVCKVLKELEIVQPIFLDIERKFIHTNKIIENSYFRTYLINSNNQIVYVGSPIENKKAWNIFKESVFELKQKNK